MCWPVFLPLCSLSFCVLGCTRACHRWSVTLPDLLPGNAFMEHNGFVLTEEAASMQYLMDLANTEGLNVLLAGHIGSGRTACVEQFVSTQHHTQAVQQLVCSRRTSPAMLCGFMSHCTERRSGEVCV